MKRIILIISLLLAFTNVKAANDDTCKREELNRLKAVAKEIDFSYEFHEEKDENGVVTGGKFDIILNNVSKEVKPLIIYSWLNMRYDEFVPDKNGMATSKSFNPDGYEPGNNIRITVKGYVANPCAAKDLMTKTVKLPYFNFYKGTGKCKIYPKFKYCQNNFLENHITQERFDSELEKYLKAFEKEAPTMVVDNSGLYIMIGVSIAVPVLIIGTIVFVKWYKRKEELSI